MKMCFRREYNTYKPSAFNGLEWPMSERVLRVGLVNWRGEIVDFIDIRKSDLEWLLKDEVQKN